MIEYLIGLFEDMSLLTAVLLGAGVLLCIVETFVPKVGLTGLLGISLLACGISSYYIDGFKFIQIIGIVSIIALILAVFIMIELVLESKGIIRNPNRYKFRTYNDILFSLNDLVGRQAKAITNIDMGGTVEVDGKLYYAISNSAIAQGSVVQIVGVQNNALVVKL